MPRRPKPPHLVSLEGRRGHRPDKPVRGIPLLGPAPDIVAGDPDASEEWARVVASLPEGHLADADHPTLAIHALAWGILCSARRELERDGMICTGSQGQQRPHPCIQIVQQQAKRLQQTADRLGLDPVARNRFALIALVPLDPDDDDDLSDLLRG